MKGKLSRPGVAQSVSQSKVDAGASVSQSMGVIQNQNERSLTGCLLGELGQECGPGGHGVGVPGRLTRDLPPYSAAEGGTDQRIGARWAAEPDSSVPFGRITDERRYTYARGA